MSQDSGFAPYQTPFSRPFSRRQSVSVSSAKEHDSRSLHHASHDFAMIHCTPAFEFSLSAEQLNFAHLPPMEKEDVAWTFSQISDWSFEECVPIVDPSITVGGPESNTPPDPKAVTLTLIL